ILCAWSSFLDLLYLIVLRLRSLYISPPGVIRSATGAIIPLVYIDSVSAKTFDFVLDVMFETIYSRQHADNAKNSNGNSEQRKKSAELIFPKLLHSHFKTAAYNLNGSAHGANLPQAFQLLIDFICMVTRSLSG